MIKYELSTTCCWCSKRAVQLLGSTKNWPYHEPCCAPPQKIPFINAVQPFMGVNKMRVINITVTVSARASVTVSVSLVRFVSGNNSVALCIVIWWIKYMTLSQIRSIADLRNYAPEIREHSINLCILIEFAFHRSTLILLTVLRSLSNSVRSSN